MSLETVAIKSRCTPFFSLLLASMKRIFSPLDFVQFDGRWSSVTVAYNMDSNFNHIEVAYWVYG